MIGGHWGIIKYMMMAAAGTSIKIIKKNKVI